MTALFYAALGVAGLVVYGLGRAVLARMAAGGEAKARAERAESDLSVAKKQAEIMAEDRSDENVLSRLDRGDF